MKRQIPPAYLGLTEKFPVVLEAISMLSLSLLRPGILEQIDAGLGVGRPNFQVQFRAAKTIRIEGANYYCRLHLAKWGLPKSC